MAVRSSTLIVLLAVLAAASAAGLLETLLSWELPDVQARSTVQQSKCLCQPSGCLCCVDLNLTASIDLGGPACVNIMQKEQNVSLNLSYGDNPVHNATIRVADAADKPTCINLLSDLAQICARFATVKKSDLGYDACLVIEPALLGTSQATYHIGCFNFNQGVRQIEASPIVETSEASESSDDEDDTINTDELIAAVSASAEQGIALFSQWLGLNLNPKLNFTKKESNGQQQQPQQHAEAGPNTRNSRKLADDQSTVRPADSFPSSTDQARAMQAEVRTLPIGMDILHEKSDERFKRILSAQDNILKGSAKIGHASGAETTFVYSKPVDLVGSQKQSDIQRQVDEARITSQRLTVPRESRRGGRAYNIHQHVNEI